MDDGVYQRIDENFERLGDGEKFLTIKLFDPRLSRCSIVISEYFQKFSN